LQDAAELATKNGGKNGLLENEPFEHVFGGKSRRKRVKLEQFIVARTEEKEEAMTVGGGMAQVVPKGPEDDADGYSALWPLAQQSSDTYQGMNARRGNCSLGSRFQH
jgi:hypothetical protein